MESGEKHHSNSEGQKFSARFEKFHAYSACPLSDLPKRRKHFPTTEQRKLAFTGQKRMNRTTASRTVCVRERERERERNAGSCIQEDAFESLAFLVRCLCLGIGVRAITKMQRVVDAVGVVDTLFLPYAHGVDIFDKAKNQIHARRGHVCDWYTCERERKLAEWAK